MSQQADLAVELKLLTWTTSTMSIERKTRQVPEDDVLPEYLDEDQQKTYLRTSTGVA